MNLFPEEKQCEHLLRLLEEEIIYLQHHQFLDYINEEKRTELFSIIKNTYKYIHSLRSTEGDKKGDKN